MPVALVLLGSLLVDLYSLTSVLGAGPAMPLLRCLLVHSSTSVLRVGPCANGLGAAS